MRSILHGEARSCRPKSGDSLPPASPQKRESLRGGDDGFAPALGVGGSWYVSARPKGGASGVDFYAVYVLPPGSENHLIPADPPEECI
jgi:hypothetical protein